MSQTCHKRFDGTEPLHGAAVPLGEADRLAG